MDLKNRLNKGTTLTNQIMDESTKTTHIWNLQKQLQL